MGFLLTAGVLGFQAVIFLTIVGAGAMGRGKLWLVTAGWVAFTLFGSIFTAGLLLLQLFTIAVSFSIGNAAAGRRLKRPEVQPVVASSKSEEPSSTPIEKLLSLLIVGGILWIAYLLVGQPSQVARAPATQIAPIAPVQALSEPPTVKAKQKESSRLRQYSARNTQKNAVRSDLRHCLTLKSNQEIARCTERAR